jgi:site-specific recombinase XerD
VGNIEPSGCQSFKQKLFNIGLDNNVVNLICSSCSSSTWKSYESQYKKFVLFCNENSISIRNIQISNILSYFTHLFELGLSYSTINAARSTLSLLLANIDNYKIGEHPLVVRLLKGVAKQRPPTPKYSNSWDVDAVIDAVKKLPKNEDLDLYLLSVKLAGLLALISGQRVQTLSLIKIDEIKIVNSSIRIYIEGVIKTTKPGSNQPCIILPELKKDKILCVKNTLEHYLLRTKDIRVGNHLFISTKLPHKKVSSQTISHWLIKLLELSKIDVSVYKSHSFRHSSTSKAFAKGVHIDSIYNNAGWSKRSKVFAKYYNKPCTNANEFANVVLNK